MMLSFLCFHGLAAAGIPVVHEEPSTERVLAEVGQVSGLAAPDFESVLIRNLVRKDPVILGPAKLEPCTQAAGSTLAALKDTYGKAEGAYLYMRDLETEAAIRTAEMQLSCLTDPADRDLGARVFLLAAAQALSKKDAPAARAALQRALAFSFTVPWDTRFPAEGKAILEDERKKVNASVRLEVRPFGGEAGPWIDGVAAPEGRVTLAPGRHLAQLRTPDGVVSTWIDLVAGGNSTIVIPSAFKAPVLDGMADPVERPMVEALLRATLPEVRAAYAYYQGGIWLLVFDADGGVRTTEIQPMKAALQTAAQVPTAPLLKLDARVKDPSTQTQATDPATESTTKVAEEDGTPGHLLLWGGGGLAVVGAGVATYSFAGAVGVRNQACESIAADDRCVPSADEPYDEAKDRYDALRTWTIVGEAATLVGLGMVGVSFLGAEIVPFAGSGFGVELRMEGL